MRRIIGLVLMGLAGFLITTALLALIYIPGQVKRTPLDTDSITRLSGEAAVLPTGGSAPVKAMSHTVADGTKSDGDVVVFDSFTCLVTNESGDTPDCVDDTDPDRRLISASTDRFATDRRTGMAVNDKKYTGDATAHQGLVNKFPFGVEKKTYPFWDGLLGRAVDAKFEGEEKVDGLDTYKFVIDVQDEPAEIASGIQGTYSSLKTMWIDPVTGAIQKQTEQQKRAVANGTPVLQLDFGFTDETVAANVKAAKDNGSQLSLVSRVPLIAGLLGLLSLIGGFLLWRGGREGAASTSASGTSGPDYGGSGDLFGDDDTTPRSRSDLHQR